MQVKAMVHMKTNLTLHATHQMKQQRDEVQAAAKLKLQLMDLTYRPIFLIEGTDTTSI